MRNNDKFSFVNSNFLITEMHIKRPFHHIKQFIFLLMMMPDKFTFEFHQFYQLPVELSGNMGIIMITEGRKFFSKIYFFHTIKLKSPVILNDRTSDPCFFNRKIVPERSFHPLLHRGQLHPFSDGPCLSWYNPFPYRH